MKCNWSEYNQSLINRGNINFWFSEKSLKKWRALPSGQVGRPYQFSDEAIKTLLILRFVLHLPLRQLQGFAISLIQNMGLFLPVPHFTCIGKRMKKLSISNSIKGRRVTDVVFDTSGVRVYESGEWKKEKYGGRRKWRKIHLAIDPRTGEIIYTKATEAEVHDTRHIDDILRLMNQKKGKVLIDGIADQHGLYEKCRRHNKRLLTPPRQGASQFTGCTERQEAVKIIEILGGDREARRIWAKLTGYNKRAQVEGTFSRWKRILGESLKSKVESTICCEVYIKSLILNKMLTGT